MHRKRLLCWTADCRGRHGRHSLRRRIFARPSAAKARRPSSHNPSGALKYPLGQASPMPSASRGVLLLQKLHKQFAASTTRFDRTARELPCVSLRRHHLMDAISVPPPRPRGGLRQTLSPRRGAKTMTDEQLRQPCTRLLVGTQRTIAKERCSTSCNQ